MHGSTSKARCGGSLTSLLNLHKSPRQRITLQQLCAPSRAQDVAADDAGSLLGLTNSCATAVGIAANLAAGAMGGSCWGFSGVFALTAALYLGSCLTWHACMKGDALVLNAL